MEEAPITIFLFDKRSGSDVRIITDHNTAVQNHALRDMHKITDFAVIFDNSRCVDDRAIPIFAEALMTAFFPTKTPSPKCAWLLMIAVGSKMLGI